MADKKYGGVIWTNHALSRVSDRGLTQKIVWETYRYPDEKKEGKEKGTTEFIRRVQDSTVTVIGKQNEKRQWLIISCWANPPLPGSIDIAQKNDYQKYKQSGFFGKFFLTIKKQIGL